MSAEVKTIKYEPVIGLEIHAELNTRTKMFCDSLNDPDEQHPNVNICPVCMGHPGTLPVINQDAVKKVIKVGLALGGEIPSFSQFDRKNYFYPDLPKGYQISQYEHPLVRGGELEILGRKIRIRRIHLEEDTGRLLHGAKTGVTLVDFNRAGVPLMELVTEPDFTSGEEVKKFGEELQLILRYLDVSYADMQKGEMRVEVNISLRERPTTNNQRPTTLGTKVEIKNINSFKFAEDAVNFEIERQSSLLENGGAVKQETRGWNENKKETFSQRSKESAHDYRYFPEPDLPPLNIVEDFIWDIRGKIGELPAEKRARFINEYLLDDKTAEIFIRDEALAGYFEKVASEVKEWESASPAPAKRPIIKLAANFIVGDFLRFLNETSSSVKDTLITPENFGEFLALVAEDKISSSGAKIVFEEMFRTGQDPSLIIKEKNLEQTSDQTELEEIAKKVIADNQKAMEDYKKGNSASLQFLMGQVMKESKGRANPKIAQEIIKKLLGANL